MVDKTIVIECHVNADDTVEFNTNTGMIMTTGAPDYAGHKLAGNPILSKENATKLAYHLLEYATSRE